MSLFTLLLVLWGTATAAFLAVMGWKSLIGMREEDIVILDPAEAHRVSEQQQVIDTMVRLTRLAKTFGFASLGLMIVVGGIWAYRGYLAFNGQTP
jgi:hypothetical protein